MKLSRRELLAASAAAVVTGTGAEHVHGSAAPRPQAPPRPGAAPRTTPNLTIRDYLSREARQITDHALAGLTNPAAFRRQMAGRRERFVDMMGLAGMAPAGRREPVPCHVTGVVDRPTYRIEKLYYESLPNLNITANLYLPKSATPTAPRPGVLYVCGHAPRQKVHYQAHPKRLAELGFPTLLVETVQLGEVEGYHHGCHREGWFHWYSRGYSPAAIELLNGIRALDLLAARPDVNAERLGVTGISGGGAVTWWIAAADERVTACAPVCGTATLESYVHDRVVDGHCDCMWFVNTAQWDLADVGALIAPRPMLIASADRDSIFPVDSIRRVHAQLEELYGTLGKPDHLRYVETPGDHSYHERSRTAIFSWFLQHLADETVPPAGVGDIELDAAKLESEATLRVYVKGAPSGDRVATIHDELITLATPPDVTSVAGLRRTRQALVEALRADTFNHFPADPPALDVEEEFALQGGAGARFAFTSEAGWRLHGVRRGPQDLQGTAPAVLVLRSPGEERNASERAAGDLEVPIRIIAEPRGTGDTSWGEDLNWHVRRASAWTGRTIASLRVWDALRALEVARQLPGVDPSRVSLAARGEMAAVALYAALLDGNVAAVFLDSPPATQDAASSPDGRGPAIEMLNCLRYTDLPQVAGLLYPAEVIVSGTVPSTYAWAEHLYQSLGPPGRFRRVEPSSNGA